MGFLPVFVRAEMDGIVEKGDYAAFQSKLIPTNYEIEGIRIPLLRKLVSSLTASELDEALKATEFRTFEEVLAYGFAVGKLKDREQTKEKIDFLLPRMDNWAHVDCITSSLKIVEKNREYFLNAFEHFKTDEGEFTKRFLAVMLMDYYLTDEYIDRALKIYREISEGQYYVDMAVAWALSVVLVKYFDRGVEELKSGAYGDFTHNKAIQKAVESFRLSDEQKAYLRTLKRKLRKNS